jgi:hypothetical protein
MENLDRVVRSQDLPDANWLLASSPALNPRALTLVPMCAVVFFFCFLSFLTSCFLQILLCAYDLDKHQTVYNTCGRNERVYEHGVSYGFILMTLCQVQKMCGVE